MRTQIRHYERKRNNLKRLRKQIAFSRTADKLCFASSQRHLEFFSRNSIIPVKIIYNTEKNEKLQDYL